VGTHAAVFQKGDVGDLRDKLQGLLDQPELAASYRRGAAAYILRRFNWEDVVEKTLGLYTNNASIPSGKIGTAERQR
jgi:glycosyltransferase involved in cell wall biosynthesis